MKKNSFMVMYRWIVLPIILGFLSCTKEDFKSDVKLSNRHIIEPGGALGGWRPPYRFFDKDHESTERKPQK